MSKFNEKKVMPRYSLICMLLTLVALAVLIKAGYIMTAQRSYWEQVAKRETRDSVPVPSQRGNILSDDGQLLASSLPEFKLYMDFKQLHEAKNDSLWEAKLDSICMGLHDIFPEKSAHDFKAHLEKGRREGKRYYPIWPKRVNYNTYSEVKQLPVFCLKRFQSGFIPQELQSRTRPYGNMAARTIGSMFNEKDMGRTPRCGLEFSYDSLLRGTDGLKDRRKVLSKYMDIIQREPVEGADIMTTINVNMQDLAERAVLKKLQEIDAEFGVAIVMEVKTGDIKAIVNLERCVDGKYREIQNHAVTDLVEPGSVFKAASVMTALEDGVCDTTFKIPTGNGVWHVYGRDMKDSHWRSGGYGTISLGKAMELSSNIGVSYMVDHFYHNTPEKFVKGIWRTGINDPNISIPIEGHARPSIRMPERYPNGQWKNWSKTALLWMSIGYETQIPPIYTLTFYNAIANNGRMMQPRFVKATVKNGDTLTAYPPQVVKGREQIASEKTIKIMQDLLHRVVINGTGKKANSPNFWVCGKTGTAMIAKNGSYKGAPNHLLSFAGWFGEKDKPYYSCIVCIQKQGLPAYGWMSGQVFKDIAEGIMAKYVRYDISDARDSTSHPIPDVKNGNIFSAQRVLSLLGINTTTNYATPATQAALVWGEAQRNAGSVLLKKEGMASRKHIPNVMGMGARDAVYLIESRGVRCIVRGRGKVVEQSLEPGHYIKKGEICTLKLE